MTIKQTLGAIVLAGAIGLAGCSVGPELKPKDYIEGTVVREYGDVRGIVESSGAWFGNEAVRLGNRRYGLTVQTPEGEYTFDVGDLYGGSHGPKTMYNLAARIEVGTRIKFPTSYDRNFLASTNAGFTDDRIGSVDPDDIQILE